MGALKIVTMNNQDERFYRTLGPFLSRRDIVAELGAPVWDDDEKQWFVAMVGRKVAGFAALRVVGKHLSLVSAYVVPRHRKAGVYTALLAARVEAAGGLPLKAIATDGAITALRRAGLKKTGARGSYVVMERT